ncbi:MAG: polymer-forming cytoskeletal protein [Anaerolineales bacterium]|nr:polymer-forming cytoskeletal protein [Anaerolineales bacterium]
MRNWKYLFWLLAVMLLSACQPADSYQGRVILSGSHQLGEDEVVPGDLVVVDGEVVLEQGSRVEGSLLVLGGSVSLDGVIEGDITILRGKLQFREQARVKGNLNAGGGHLLGWQEAAVGGEITENIGWELPGELMMEPNLNLGEQMIRRIVFSLTTSVLVFLWARFLPGPVQRVGDAAVDHPLVCGALGVLVFIVGPVLVVQMVFTVVLIPVAGLTLILGALTALYGLAGLGIKLGSWFQEQSGLTMARAAQAAWGSFLISLLIQGLNFVPLLGGMTAILITAVILGAVLLTRFGTRVFIPDQV